MLKPVKNKHQPHGEEKLKPHKAAVKACKEVGEVPAGNTNRLGSKLQQMILLYYQDVRRQAQQSFYSALGAASIGTLFFIAAAWLSINDNDTSSTISVIAGSLIQIISGLNFYLYSKTTRQFSAFHLCLERTNRFLLANTLCDNLSDKDAIRQKIIETIMNSPMLTESIIKGNGEALKESSMPKDSKKSDPKPQQQPETGTNTNMEVAS